ncbi:PAS domain S-box-containing protein [Maridesulfovibrio ferrireducens]|uniref:histidine kinase n=1 Tax=Maridesulfovibrio ferrireducens TaxID=246191 RepID=A0A1G9FT81_9BACT|nr:PAS domain S-box protein [Maridesulfovibrio ferrireducens]SDK91636.1 PAS domain S-box-containing protein [Maridesulfovibrio ferrireducens]
MLEQKRRIILLAMIMVFLVGAVSIISTWLLYQTSLNEQKARLSELVESQASLTRELSFISTELNLAKDKDNNTENFLSHLARAHKRFKIGSSSGEFTVGLRSDKNIQFLILNGERITANKEFAFIPFGSAHATPMQLALSGKRGTLIDLDYRGQEVLAAYTSIVFKGQLIGLVAKLDIEEIKNPFFKANFTIFTSGILLTLFGLFFFFKLSEPILHKIKNSEKNYRNLVEGAHSLILRIDQKGIISFANSFSKKIFESKEQKVVGLTAVQVLTGQSTDQNSSAPLRAILTFFGEGEGPHEKPISINNGSTTWISWRVRKIIDSKGEVEELLCIGNDTTANHIARENLLESESRHRIIFENSPLGMVRLNPEGTILDCNNKLIEMLGSTREKTIGFNAAQNGPLKMQEVLRNALNGKSSIYEDLFSATTGNKTSYIRAIFNPVSPGKSSTEVIGTLEDISERMKVEKRLAESEERFRGIAIASPVGIIITDIEGQLLYANERMNELTGMNYTDQTGHAWMNSVQQEDKSNIKINWYGADFITKNRIEFRLIHQKGHTLWILGQIVELKNSDDQMIGYVVTMTDITQIKTAEQEHKRLSAAVDQAAEAIMITSIEGIITYVNPAFHEISGYSPQEAIGKNPRFLKSGEQDITFYDNMWDTILGGHIWKGILVNIKKDGKRYTQEATIGPVRDESGKIINFVCVARDISQQLIIEAQLRQAQKLESIGELAAGIAHEINTPTQYVSTNTQFMAESFATLLGMIKNCKNLIEALQSGNTHNELVDMAETALDEEELAYLEEDVPKAIAESVIGLKRISEIVKSVKQLAHPGEVHKGLHHLNEIVRNAVTVSSNEWKYISEVELNLDDNLPEIYCLKGEIGQVVLNLIINGAHAIESKIGTDSEEKGCITITTYKEKEWAVLEVSDTGTGMPQNVVDRAFDPFFTTKEVGKGTGQGLAITHNVIVNMHNGFINVDTEEGNGTTFTVKLPLK